MQHGGTLEDYYQRAATMAQRRKSLVLGKTGHFRKSGIPIPTTVYQNDLHRLLNLIQYFQPRNIIFVGDLTHSHENMELNLFKKWRNDLEHIEMHLVKGNHDILSSKWYEEAGLQIHHPYLSKGPFEFIHDPLDQEEQTETYTFCGHLHPGVLLKGYGKQSLRFPCFHFGKKICLLPAFSEFSGMALVDAEKDDTRFVIVERKIIPLQ